MKIGYARVSTKHQDLATQEDGAVATWGGSQESSVFIV